jgi:hypothetical protein
MKIKKISQSGTVSGPLLERILALDQANFQAHFPIPGIGSKPLPSAALFQDPGNGYRTNLTYPQK